MSFNDEDNKRPIGIYGILPWPSELKEERK